MSGDPFSNTSSYSPDIRSSSDVPHVPSSEFVLNNQYWENILESATQYISSLDRFTPDIKSILILDKMRMLIAVSRSVLSYSVDVEITTLEDGERSQVSDLESRRSRINRMVDVIEEQFQELEQYILNLRSGRGVIYSGMVSPEKGLPSTRSNNPVTSPLGRNNVNSPPASNLPRGPPPRSMNASPLTAQTAYPPRTNNPTNIPHVRSNPDPQAPPSLVPAHSSSPTNASTPTNSPIPAHTTSASKPPTPPLNDNMTRLERLRALRSSGVNGNTS